MEDERLRQRWRADWGSVMRWSEGGTMSHTQHTTSAKPSETPKETAERPARRDLNTKNAVLLNLCATNVWRGAHLSVAAEGLVRTPAVRRWVRHRGLVPSEGARAARERAAPSPGTTAGGRRVGGGDSSQRLLWPGARLRHHFRPLMPLCSVLSPSLSGDSQSTHGPD